MAVAVDQHQAFKPFIRPQRCRLQSHSQLEYTMIDLRHSNLRHSLQNAFELANIPRSLSTPCLSVSSTSDEEHNIKPKIEILAGHEVPKVYMLVAEVAMAIASGISPEPVSSGLGGAYVLRARNGDTLAITKPIDEEPLAFNNPKGFAGRMLGQPGIKPSIMVGETGHRELAAYLLDHGGFAGVPPTALVKFSHVAFNSNSSEPLSDQPCKIASLQSFVDHDSDAGDLGPSGFSVSSTHRIGILDIRLLNLDRHSGNILVKQGQESYAIGAAELVPIDHGFCLPESLDDPYFEWLHWPQASIPFSEHEIEYISNLDPFKDAEILRKEVPSIRESSVRVLVLCTIFLKHAAACGMCLAEIGEMMTRELHAGEESWSALENICMSTKAILRSILKDNIVSYQKEDMADQVFQLDDKHVDSISPMSDSESSLLAGKPQKIPRISLVKSMGTLGDTLLLHADKDKVFQIDNCRNAVMDDTVAEEDDGCEKHRSGGLKRSMGVSVVNSSDCGCISFGEMTDKEWNMFIEIFEKLLPDAFERRKSLSLSKQWL